MFETEARRGNATRRGYVPCASRLRSAASSYCLELGFERALDLGGRRGRRHFERRCERVRAAPIRGAHVDLLGDRAFAHELELEPRAVPIPEEHREELDCVVVLRARGRDGPAQHHRGELRVRVLDDRIAGSLLLRKRPRLIGGDVRLRGDRTGIRAHELHALVWNRSHRTRRRRRCWARSTHRGTRAPTRAARHRDRPCRQWRGARRASNPRSPCYRGGSRRGRTERSRRVSGTPPRPPCAGSRS